MCRQQIRKDKREKDKLRRKVNNMDENTTVLINILAESKFDNYVRTFKSILNDATFKAMRENKISEERANGILDRINEIVSENN